jgi:anti-sigma regulatory factor (Ser/Thr protein kinase)
MAAGELRPAAPRCRADSLELGAYESAVPSARLHARAVLAEWRLAPLVDDVENVVAELVANAIAAHQRERLDEPVGLALFSDAESVLVVVRDSSSRQPVRHDPDLDLGGDCEHGRGLLIVEALSRWTDCRPVPPAHGGGKLVRALIALP